MAVLPKKFGIRTDKGRRLLQRFKRSTSANFLAGNSVKLFKTGSLFFDELFAAIESANETISLEFYIIKADNIGRHLSDLLVQAVSRGVNVSLLYDYIGCFDTPAAYFRNMQLCGIKVAAFNPPPFHYGISWFDKRNHRKIAVIDCRVAFTGGLNIGDEYAGWGEALYWRDIGIRINGPGVLELSRIFGESWQSETSQEYLICPPPEEGAACGNDDLAIVNGSPHHNRSRIRAAFRLAIAGAGRSILIQTPYFVPGPRFIIALLRAARRGVKVQMILPARSDIRLVQLVNRSSYSTLISGGIEVFEREGTILHGKMMLIDGRWAVLGSANLDQRSFHRNFEVNVIVSSAEFGAQVDGMFAEDISMSRRISLDEHEKRGFLVRLLEKIIKPLNWFL